MLRQFYCQRFGRVLFLMPFDSSAEADDVHICCGGGASFDMMIVGAREKILSYFSDYDAVLFAHNDLLLNPALSRDTLSAEYDVDQGTILMPNIGNLAGGLDYWVWAYRAAMNWQNASFLFASGAFFAKNYLPSVETAKNRVRELGLSDRTTLDPASPTFLATALPIHRLVHDTLFGASSQPIELGYPLMYGYSDFVVVPHALMPEWFDNLGPLAGLSLFPEVSIPTATALTAKRLTTPALTGHKSHLLWGADRIVQNDIEWIKNAFHEGDTFIHPVKYNELNENDLSNLKAMFNPSPS